METDEVMRVRVTKSVNPDRNGEKAAVIRRTPTGKYVVRYDDGREDELEEGQFVVMQEFEVVLPKASHYKENGIECYDVIRAALGIEGLKSFCEGNIIKYSFRMRKKGQYWEDVKKIRDYADEILKLGKEEGV